MNVCDVCKTENLNNSSFCSNCGNSLIEKKYVTSDFIKKITQNTFAEDIILVFNSFLKNILGWIFLLISIYLITFIPLLGKLAKFLFAGFFTILYSFFCFRKTISSQKIVFEDLSFFLNKKYLNYFILLLIEIILTIILFILSGMIFLLFYSIFAGDISISSDLFSLLVNILPYLFLTIGIYSILKMFLSFLVDVASFDVILKKDSSPFSSIKKVFNLLNKKIAPITIYYLKVTAFFIPVFIFILLFSLLYLNIFMNIPINIFLSIDALQSFLETNGLTTQNIQITNSISIISTILKYISKIGFLIFLINIMISPIYNLFNTIAYFKFFYSEE